MLAATYTKLNDGNWGLRIQGKGIERGTVLVTKKSGESKEVTVGKVVYFGNGITLARTVADSHSRSSRESYQCQCRNCMSGNESLCQY